MSVVDNRFAMTRIRAAALHLRAGRADPADEPSSSPLSSLLRSAGYPVEEIRTPVLFSPLPLKQARAVIGSLVIIWRHPDPSMVVVSRVERAGGPPSGSSLSSSLRGFLTFVRYCSIPEAGIQGVLAGVDPCLRGPVSGERLGLFALRTIGLVETIAVGNLLWYVGDPRDPRRHP